MSALRPPHASDLRGVIPSAACEAPSDPSRHHREESQDEVYGQGDEVTPTLVAVPSTAQQKKSEI
jgi:hypothetical protein